jgi:hypothetical protein
LKINPAHDSSQIFLKVVFAQTGKEVAADLLIRARKIGVALFSLLVCIF